jgi:hypothetical protein
LHGLLVTLVGMGVGDLLGLLVFRGIQYWKHNSFWPDDYALSNSEKELLINKNINFKRDPEITQRIVYLLAMELEREHVFNLFTPVITSDKYDLLKECIKYIKNGSDDLSINLLVRILVEKLKLSGHIIEDKDIFNKINLISRHEKSRIENDDGKIKLAIQKQVYEALMYYVKDKVLPRSQNFENIEHDDLMLDFKRFIVFSKQKAGNNAGLYNLYLVQWLVFTLSQVLAQNLEIFASNIAKNFSGFESRYLGGKKEIVSSPVLIPMASSRNELAATPTPRWQSDSLFCSSSKILDDEELPGNNYEVIPAARVVVPR